MSYRDNIQREHEQSAKEQAARNIHERLEKITLMGAAEAARRWFWELLQNARDVALNDAGIRARVHLQANEETVLQFSHDGGPFTSGDLVRLIEQDSNKRKEIPEDRPRPIGRFGTGFLTTHLLARVVDVEGIAHDPGEQSKHFHLPLDRSGSTIDDLQRGVEATFEALSTLDEQPPIANYLSGNFNTIFSYKLDDEGLAVAQTGLTDLHKFLPLVLALSRRINSVEVIHDQMLYTVSDRSHLADEIEQVTVSKESPEGTSSSTLIVVSKDRERVALAIPVEIEEGTIRLLELPADTPRLFCDFPLIGTEAFQLPVIVNSPLFHPTEPRDGVVLTDAGHFKPEENKEIFKEVVRLYLRIVEYAAENRWKSLFVLAGLREAPKREWLSQTWFKSAVLQPIREQLLITPIVETADGALKAMKTAAGDERVRFPYDAKEEVRAGIWRFASDWQESKLPRREHIDAWYDLLWSACPTLNVVKLIQSISATKSSVGLAEMLNRSEKETISWLSNLVEFLVNTGNEKYLDVFQDIIHYPSGKSFVKPKEQYPILPNQHGIFHVKQKLYLDDDINEQLKNIAEALGKDYRAELLHKDIALIDPGHKALTQQDVAKEIERRVRERISSNDRSEQTRLAFSQLLRWFDDNLALAQDLFGSLYEDQHLLQTAEEARDIRRHAARARDLERENAELHVQRETLVNEKEQLQAEIHKLREQLDRFQATGHTPPDAGDDERGTEARLHAQQLLEVWKAIKEALGQLGTEESRKAMRDLGTWLTEHPELFRHLSDTSREAYLNWLSKVMRAKGEVRAFLERQPDERYDLTGWDDDSRFPTIVTGVKYYGRDVTLVIRPADGGFIVLYEELERAILERPDTELWIQGGRFEAQRFNIGKLVSFLNVNRLPLEVPIPRPAALYLN